MSTLNYAGDAYNHAAGTRNAFGGLSDALVAEGHPAMKVVDGDREKQDQLDIWYARMTLNPGNRRVYGTAWWQGQKWYRIHPDAVGVPDTSNHEKRRANDLAWPYNSNTAAHRRAQELAPNYGITCEGLDFGEWWHWTFWGDLGAIGAGGGSASSSTATPNQSEEDEMPKNTGVIYRSPQNAPASQTRHVALIHNTGSGFEFEVDNGTGGGPFDGSVTTGLAVAYDTPSWVEVSEGAAANIKRGLAAVRSAKS